MSNGPFPPVGRITHSYEIEMPPQLADKSDEFLNGYFLRLKEEVIQDMKTELLDHPGKFLERLGVK